MKQNRKPLGVFEPAPGYDTPGGEIVLYNAPDGSVNLDVRLKQDTLGLTQKQMAELFQKERSVITKHLRNIFETRELNRESNVQKMHIPISDKPVELFNPVRLPVYNKPRIICCAEDFPKHVGLVRGCLDEALSLFEAHGVAVKIADQSLNRKGVVKDIVADYGQVLVDECHHIPVYSFKQVLKKCKARCVLGLTATPLRKDDKIILLLED